MKFMYKMEQKFGRYAIRNLSLALIICYAVGYVLELINSEFLSFLTLNPYLILHGQVWRLFSWILIPPGSFDFFTLIMLYFYFSIGTNLERTWGAFRYNFYLFGGMLFTILGSFAVMGYGYLEYGEIINAVGAKTFFTTGLSFGGLPIGGIWFYSFSTYFVNMSIFLAFAATFPDIQIYLMFLVPIKIKYLGAIYAIMLIWQFARSSVEGQIVIAASLLNFVVFFLLTRNYKRVSPKEIHRKQKFRREVRAGQRGDNTVPFRGRTTVTRHRCAVCGRTELDDDNLEFRFCSKCDGNYEYCMEHLYTHEHVHHAQGQQE
ncbi:MAG: hypothetical protein K2N94_15955 [Lachnospiraceae bacterium]|nr:hypothetical protein [Lachnospiraceae bacterium]